MIKQRLKVRVRSYCSLYLRTALPAALSKSKSIPSPTIHYEVSYAVCAERRKQKQKPRKTRNQCSTWETRYVRMRARSVRRPWKVKGNQTQLFFSSRKLPVPVLVRIAHGTVNARGCMLLTCWKLLLKMLLNNLVLCGWHIVLLLPLLVCRGVQVVE